MRADISNAIATFQIKTFGNQKNIERTESMLGEDEIVHYISPTNATFYQANTRKKETLPGIIVLTDKRVLFTFKAGFSEAIKEYSLSEVRAINCSGNGLTGGQLEIQTLTETVQVLISYKKELMRQLQTLVSDLLKNYKIQAAMSSRQPQTCSAADEILKLKNLLDVGAITQEEFDAKKKQLLNL